MSTRELIALLTGLGVLIALSYAFDIVPRSRELFLLGVPVLLVAFAVDYVLHRGAERE